MTEFVLFILVGAIAVAAAVMMLLSDNAVYSALFLLPGIETLTGAAVGVSDSDGAGSAARFAK